jgi:flagellar hook assembly protein FlgD
MTEVRYEVARTANVSIKVYNAMGQHVTTLVDDRVEPGRYAAHWDGKNFAGETVSSGVYFYKMNAGSFNATKKMLILK